MAAILCRVLSCPVSDLKFFFLFFFWVLNIRGTAMRGISFAYFDRITEAEKVNKWPVGAGGIETGFC